MPKYYITKNYTELQEQFLARFTEENSTYTIKDALLELDSYVKAYNQEKRRFLYVMKHKPFPHPKTEAEEYLNTFWIPKNSDNMPVNKDIRVQKWQFIAMEGAIRTWLTLCDLTDKAKDKILDRIERYKIKIELV